MSRFITIAFLSLSVLFITALADDHSKPSTRGGLTGVQEFFTSSTFTVPKGVSHVMVTMWGAGGGGGAGGVGTACHAGGFGGGGGYTNTVVPVVADSTYIVTVGSGGAGGVNAGDNGTNGGDSEFALGSQLLAFAGGGQGATGATASADGTSGSGGRADGNAQISHAGPYAFNLIPDPGPGLSREEGGFAGFSPACGSARGSSGKDGFPGYVLLTF